METMRHPRHRSISAERGISADRAGVRRAARTATALIAAALIAGACSTKEEEFDGTPADQLYNQGLALTNSGKYSKAAQQFDKVEKEHPYSRYSQKALIMAAYTNYTSGKFDDAIIAARRYATLHPTDPDTAYALYIIGQSYFKQIPDVTRDQKMTEKALAAMQEVVTRFPESEYADDANRKINITRDQLAGKEMEVGRYYLARRNYIAAINRFRVVVTKYQTTRHIEEALARLTESYYSLGVVSEAQTAAAVLGHNFPDSEWYKDAYTLLREGGYKPDEDKASWISKAFSGTGLI
ncbi:outer membrane protein assembly factor BamD [Rhodobium gokarnense]|uniref:outer membrane protein assembly factor BamD n=1 Tax=Rhodobium gokarnense TaxID=364296 RepID=UPI00387380DA